MQHKVFYLTCPIKKMSCSGTIKNRGVGNTAVGTDIQYASVDSFS